MKSIDVLCIGYACWDLIFRTDTYPGPDEKAVAQSLSSEGGGPAANAAFSINRLGGKAAFVGRLGNDYFGRAHLKELESIGVDTSCAIITKAPTPTSSIWVNQQGQRAIVNHRETGTNLEHNFDQMNPACLLMDGHEPEASFRALKQFPGIPSILDAGSRRDSTEQLSKRVTHVVASSAFAEAMSQSKDPDNWIECLAEGSGNVAITNGAQGVFWKDSQGQRGHIRALQTRAVDTTAAGDIFHGAFALALSRKNSFAASLTWANHVAGISVGRMGGRSSCPNLNDVSALDLRKQKN